MSTDVCFWHAKCPWILRCMNWPLFTQGQGEWEGAKDADGGEQDLGRCVTLRSQYGGGGVGGGGRAAAAGWWVRPAGTLQA